MKKETISIIGGTGDQGRGLAMRWAAAGYEIVIGSRDALRAESAAAAINELLVASGLPSSVRGVGNFEAAASGTVIVLTVPFAAQIATLKEIREAIAPGALFIDVTVPLEPAVGGRPTRVLGVWAGSAAEQSAEILPAGTLVISAFQNVAASVLADLGHEVDCDIIVCGDDKTARERGRPLVVAIAGCRFIDGGPLANSRVVEALTAMLIGFNIRYRSHTGIRITGINS